MIHLVIGLQKRHLAGSNQKENNELGFYSQNNSSLKFFNKMRS